MISIFNIIELLEKQLPTCSPAEEKVAQYILKNPKQITMLSTNSLATLSQSSPASIIRLCKRIGIDSFKKLKLQLAIELEQSAVDNYATRIPFGDLPTISLENINKQYVDALHKTALTLDMSQVQLATSLIHQSNKLCFYGASESSLVAMDAYYKLMRIDENVFFSQDSHITLVYVTNMQENDVLFLISLSGKTKEVLELIQIAKRRKVKIILLTQSPKSPAAKDADVLLCTSKEEVNLRVATMTARITQLSVIDLLFTTIMNQKGTHAINCIIETHNTLQYAKRT